MNVKMGCNEQTITKRYLRLIKVSDELASQDLEGRGEWRRVRQLLRVLEIDLTVMDSPLLALFFTQSSCNL
jgi:hypothetical protein